MKTIFVVERTDNHGEFQPIGNCWDWTRTVANTSMEDIQEADKFSPSLSGRKYRIMPYVRQENRS